jgi:hypothetical protein
LPFQAHHRTHANCQREAQGELNGADADHAVSIF